jgi:hypothetical protein
LRAWIGQGDCRLAPQVERSETDDSILPRRGRDPRLALDGSRQHKAVVVTRVFADDVNAPRRPGKHGGIGTESRTEGGKEWAGH